MKYLAQSIFGTITPPGPLGPGGKFQSVENGGIGQLLNLIFNVLIVFGGIYAVFNLILAGYAFFSAGDDSKKVEGAWAKIRQTAIGLLFMAGAFVLAAIFSQLIFGRPDFILNPTIPAL